MGAAECVGCLPGTYANTTGAAACTPCSAGLFQSAQGDTACMSCQKGRYSTSAAAECSSCGEATYQVCDGIRKQFLLIQRLIRKYVLIFSAVARAETSLVFVLELFRML